jgi:L-aspartate oxidase
MTGAAGVLRTGPELDAAAAQLARWTDSIGATEPRGTREFEDRNLLLAARLLVAAALNRTESVGAHYRADTEPVLAPTHSMQRISS